MAYPIGIIAAGRLVSVEQQCQLASGESRGRIGTPAFGGLRPHAGSSRPFRP